MVSLSNNLIIISTIITISAFFNPEIYIFGMNDHFLNSWKYHLFFAQFFTSNFLHGWVFHLLMNSVFLYYFWNVVEYALWPKRYFFFFLSSVFFIGIAVLLLWNGNTIGISWFWMALLTYYTLELRRIGNQDYRGGITAIILNVWIGLLPQVSLIWHLFWAIYWAMFYYLMGIKKTTLK